MNNVLNKMIAYFGSDVRRINHALKVYGFAAAIAKCCGVTEDEENTMLLAAALHDIGIHEAVRKYHSTAGKYQEMEGPPIVEEMLKGLNTEPQTIKRVCFIIGNHHSYGRIDGIDFQILVEADFLVNIQEDAMDKEAIESIKSKYFKTPAGSHYIEQIYL